MRGLQEPVEDRLEAILEPFPSRIQGYSLLWIAGCGHDWPPHACRIWALLGCLG